MYKNTFIARDATLLHALSVIDHSAAGIALVVDPGEHLQGTVSDGDIRRGLLRGLSLDASVEEVMVSSCFSVNEHVSRAQVLDIMQAKRFNQIPIVDAENRIVGLHLLHSLLSSRHLPNAAIIMAGGKGTRLGTLTRDLPKPMLKVAGRPILERIILHLLSYGISHIYLAVNYLSDVIEAHFGNGESLGCHIEYLREEKPLGSGGALSLLPEDLDDPVISLNGDLITEVNFQSMLEYHRKHSCWATMGYSVYTHEIPFGCLEIEEGKLVDLEEKPKLTRCINAGIYVLSPESLRSVPKNVFFPITELFETALNQDKTCGAYCVDGDWIDIGQREQLDMARGV